MARIIHINTRGNTLALYDNGKQEKLFAVSTSKFGIGNVYGSNQTPPGKHVICEKIGAGAVIGTVFQERKNTGIISRVYKKRKEYPYEEEFPCITTRILWLKGLDERLNKGEGIDSKERKIYIHGTPYEYDIGKFASFGCIRMCNEDIVNLFNLVEVGDVVELLEGNNGLSSQGDH